MQRLEQQRATLVRQPALPGTLIAFCKQKKEKHFNITYYKVRVFYFVLYSVVPLTLTATLDLHRVFQSRLTL